MSIAALKLSEFSPEHLAPASEGFGQSTPPPATDAAEDEDLRAALREAAYAQGFRDGVSRTREALDKEAKALDGALSAALTQDPEEVKALKAELVARLSAILDPLFETVLPTLVAEGFAQRVIEVLESAAEPAAATTILCHPDCAAHLTARLAASDLSDRVTTEATPALAYTEVVLRRAGQDILLQPERLIADVADELRETLAAATPRRPLKETADEPA